MVRSDFHVSIGNIPTSADSVSHNAEEKLVDFSPKLLIYRFTINTDYRLNQRCINPECHAASMAKFCMAAPKTRGSSIWKWLHDTLLASIEFWGDPWIFRNFVHIYTELYSTAFNETILFGDYLRKHKTCYSVNKYVIIFVTDETSINLDYTKSINFVQSLISY